MKQLSLKNLLDDLLNAITSDSFLRINKSIENRGGSENVEFVKITEAVDGYFLVLPKGLELFQKSELKNLFSLMKKQDVEKYKLNFVTQDYLEMNGHFETVWDLLDDKQLYADFDLSKHLNQEQLIELNFHRVMNNETKTKGYWFWRFYFDCIFLNTNSQIFRIYCKEWGNKFWIKWKDKK